MKVYYNEIDQKAAAWLKELMKEGLISDGDVDTRSIEDVVPAELAGYDRCHFFAGIGVWDYALNQAGFKGRCWTGSCPCQPFSTAGKGEGFDDERHLWPAWFHLIEVCRPDVIFGEQVSSKDGESWLDLVHADLEGIDYSTGTLDIPAASVGAPHRRQRFFFVADADSGEPQGRHREAHGAGQEIRIRPGSEFEYPNGRRCEQRDESERDIQVSDSGCSDGGMENAELPAGARLGQHGGEILCDEEAAGPIRSGSSSGLEITPTLGRRGRSDGDSSGRGGEIQVEGRGSLSGFTNGFWRGAEWVYCNDPDSPRWRPIEPGTFPLAPRTPGRVGLLRGYGNAIVAPVAIEFIKAYLETKEG